MSRVCCIMDCVSKSPGASSNQRTLFAIPKDPSKRQEWLDAVSPYLRKGKPTRKNLYVCDLHFTDEEVCRSFKIIVGGSADFIPRQYFMLKKNTVPSIFPHPQENIAGDTGLLSMDIWIKEEDVISTPEVAQEIAQDPLMSSDIRIKEEPESITAAEFPVEGDPEIISSDIQIKEEEESIYAVEYSQKLAQNPELISMYLCMKEEEDTISGSENTQEIAQDPRQIYHDVLVKERQENLLAIENEQEVEQNPEAKKKTTEYNIFKFEKDLNVRPIPLLLNWVFTKIRNNFCFLYFGDDFAYPSKTILVRASMIPELHIMGKLIKWESIKKICTFNDIVDLMKKVINLYPCHGIGEQSQCGIGYFESSFKPNTIRCPECRLTRKRNSDRDKKRKTRSSIKQIDMRRRIKNLTRQLSRLRNALSLAKEDISMLETYCRVNRKNLIKMHLKSLNGATEPNRGMRIMMI